MTETEQLRSELRELKMRLRELRTENVELKLHQKRWLRLSTGVSIFSLVLAFVMFFASGDIKVLGRNPSVATELDSSVYEMKVEAQKANTGEAPVVSKPIEPVQHEEDSFLDAPELEVHLESAVVGPKVVEPVRGGAFELPGVDKGPKRKVIQYVVKRNDTLWGIAKAMMGSSKSSNIAKIMKDNGLTDSRLEPGMSLVIIVEP